MTIVFDIPVKTQTGMNSRMHWAKRRKLTVEQKMVTTQKMHEALRGVETGWALLKATGRIVTSHRIPSMIRLTRKYSGRPCDDDNLRSNLKSVRDAIAAVIGIDDGDPRLQFDYKQMKTKRNDFGVTVELIYG